MGGTPHKPRILVVRGGAIGDFIMTLPAIGALRAQWPEAHLEILGYPHIASLAVGSHYADGTRSIEARAMAGFFVPNGILDPALMDYFAGFNLVVSYLYDPDHMFADNVRRCGVKRVVEASPRPSDVPAARHYCKSLEELAIYVEEPVPRVYPGENDRRMAEGYFRDLGKQPVVAVHPGSGSAAKNWPVDKFASVCRWLVDEMAVQLLVIQGEADDMTVQELTKLLAPRVPKLVRGLKLTELSAVLERCLLFLGNDSGISHLAAAVGTPTLAMFGPSSSSIWRPVGSHVQVVSFGHDDIQEVRQTLSLWLREAVRKEFWK
jgi:heptosyltransferase-2